MTPLRLRMIEDMRIRNLSQRTQTTYVEQVARFARHFGKSPEQASGGQFDLGHGGRVALLVAGRRPQKLPNVLSPEEVAAFLDAVENQQYRVILTVCYAAGLRVSEAVRLKPAAIDSRRMVIRVEAGKGRKDRYVMLSPRLLGILRDYWETAHPREWLFPGERPGEPITRFSVERACRQARERSGVTRAVTPHSLRHAFAVHLLEAGADRRTIQLLVGHRSLTTTSKYLQIATSKVCATASPLDSLPAMTPTVPDLVPA